VYLLVMQLKDRFHPHKVISLLFLSLVVPIITGLIQLPFGERVYATLGHPNALATYLALMMGLIWWRQSFSHNRLPWLSLLGILTIIYVSTRSVGAIFNIGALILILNATKLNFFKIITAIIVFLGIIALFASTEAGQARFSELLQTPLLNPDLDISRTIIVAAGDGNSFNWRVAHWYYLLQSWTQYPILGYGMGTGQFLSPMQTERGGFTPHNDYIRFLVEQGIVGLGLFLAFIAAQFVCLIKRLRNSLAGSSEHLLNLVLLSFLLANLVNMLSNNVMDIGDFWFYWWAVFSVAGWGSERFKPQDQMIDIPNYEQQI
jgi:O-antigen ligase